MVWRRYLKRLGRLTQVDGFIILNLGRRAIAIQILPITKITPIHKAKAKWIGPVPIVVEVIAVRVTPVTRTATLWTLLYVLVVIPGNHVMIAPLSVDGTGMGKGRRVHLRNTVLLIPLSV